MRSLCAGTYAVCEVGDGVQANLEMDPCMTWHLICCPMSYIQENRWPQRSSAALMPGIGRGSNTQGGRAIVDTFTETWGKKITGAKDNFDSKQYQG
jgi:hypothetical protein